MQFTLSCPVHSSYRVQQVAGMFDVAVAEKAERTFCFDPPPLDESWSIGCIVGPSGSGKSAIAKHLFGENYYTGGHWNSDQAVIDGFGDLSIKDITSMLTVVGFSSPPSWIKPYSVLSNGEQFRCDLARALLGAGTNQSPLSPARERVRVRGEEPIDAPNSPHPSPLPVGEGNKLVVFDEYTSVVDRNVAQIASAALAKGIKSGKIPCRFVAVTCHYDILEWLEPDWVLDTATGKVTVYSPEGRLLRRPSIELEIFRCERRLWEMFKTHHYLSSNLAKSCRCYAALWNANPVAFCALIPQQGQERWYRVSRIVTLPDYQGIGIGSAFLDSLAVLYVEQGFRFSITASHPSVLSHCKRSKHWKAINVMKTGSKHSKGRAVVSFVRRS